MMYIACDRHATYFVYGAPILSGKDVLYGHKKFNSYCKQSCKNPSFRHPHMQLARI